MTSNNIFCEFLIQDGEYLQCINCGTKVKIMDGGNPPMFPCTKSLRRNSDEDAPSFVDKIKNFAVAVAGHVSNGLPQCTEDQIIKRHNICLQCEFFKDDTCQKCGCPLIRNKQFVSKLAWADQECPIGKWSKEA